MSSASLYLEAVVVGECQDDKGTPVPVVNVFHYQRPASSTALNKGAFATAFDAAIGTACITELVHTTYTLVKIRVRALDDPTDPYLDVLVGRAGTRTGDRMPLEVALAYELQTGLSGRS